MSLDKMFEDIRQVGSRMQDRQQKTDNLLDRVATVQSRLETIKQYRSLIDAINQKAKRTPRNEIIARIAEEQRRIKLLQSEQNDLRTLVNEQQDAIQHIVRKLHDQLAELGELRRRDVESFKTLKVRQAMESGKYNEKLCEAYAVVSHATHFHEINDADSCAQRIAGLERENARLRDALRLRSIPQVEPNCDEDSLTDSEIASAFALVDAHAQTGPESFVESGGEFDIHTPFFADSEKRSPLNEDSETDKELLGSEKEEKRDSGCDSDE